MKRFGILLLAWAASAAASFGDEPLPSWNDGAAKTAIVDFVARVTDKSSRHYVPPQARIATFDNDGTLWAEKPVYFQLLFAIDRVKQLAPKHPEVAEPSSRSRRCWKVISRRSWPAANTHCSNLSWLLTPATQRKSSRKSWKQWIATAKHPDTGRRYTDMVYQPMLELLAYLRSRRLQDLHRLRWRYRVHAPVG